MNDVVVARRYRLGKRIGAGGMGRVWLAVDEVLRREVAIKEILLPDGLTEQETAELHQRTLREAQTAAALSHPNVIKIFDVIYAEQRPWIVMEYIESRSLAQVIKEDGPLPPEVAARIGLSVLAALVAAHEAGILHRDVKPGNVLLGSDDRVVLTDFGLATFEDVTSALTASGVVHGSPQFIAPERALDGTSTSAADMWSLGATLYAAVEGRAPYARSSSYATLTALATAPPDPPRNAGPLKPLLGGLLRRNPANRMKPDEVRSWLQQVAADTPPRSHGVPRQRRRADRGSSPDAPATASTATADAPAGSAPPSGHDGPAQAGPGSGTTGNRPETAPGGPSRRNNRAFGDSPGVRRRTFDAPPGVRGVPMPVAGRPPVADMDIGMPIAGAPPPAAVPSPLRYATGQAAAFGRPDAGFPGVGYPGVGSRGDASRGVDEERDTDRQMDLSWQLETSRPDDEAAAARSRSLQRGARRRRARRRRMIWLAAVLGFVVIAAGSAFAVDRMDRGPHTLGSGSGASAAPNGLGTPAPSPSTVASASAGVTWPCSQKSAMDLEQLPTVPAPSPSAPSLYNNLSVPQGFRWYSFGDGLVGAVPIGWIIAKGPMATCFYDPESTRILGVAEWHPGTTDPIAALKAEEVTVKNNQAFPAYQLVDFKPDPVTPGVADWEFTFNAPTATGTGTTRMHAIVHAILSPSQVPHAICWIVPDVGWSSEYAFYNLFMPSYSFGH